MGDARLTREQHQQRIENRADVHRTVRDCLRRHIVVDDYLPGQVTYNLSEYPARSSLAPTAYDEELFDLLVANGVGMIQLHEEWNDSIRRFGGHKFSSYDPDGLRVFVELAHAKGLKVIAYMSSSYFEREDPDLDPSWVSDHGTYYGTYNDYVRCSPASAGWRTYLLSHIEQALDDYGFDGLFNDDQYGRRYPLDPAHEDLLSLMYAMVKQRGGILKLHVGEHFSIPTEAKIYDYLWVGECVADQRLMRDEVKLLSPYVVPCPDFNYGGHVDEDDVYLNALPYLQFPLRVDGRPMTGERIFVEGVRYREPVEEDMEQVMARKVHEHWLAHPDGPYSYGWWDAPTPRVGARERWFEKLALYRPMVTPGSLCCIEVRDSSLFEQRLPDDVVASVYANEQQYLVLANYGTAGATVRTAATWVDRVSGETGTAWDLSARGMRFLARDVTRPDAR